MSEPNELENSMDVLRRHCDDGRTKRLFDINDHPKELVTTGSRIRKRLKIMTLNDPTNLKKTENGSSTVESLQESKSTTSGDRLNICLSNSPNTELSKMWDPVLISKDQDYYPFWDSLCLDAYNKLWLPAKTDCVDSPLNSLTISPKSLTQKSWFSIEAQTNLQTKSLQKTFSQSCKFSVVDGTKKEATKPKKPKQQKIESKATHNYIKARKIRFHPEPHQRQLLKQLGGHYRKIYNDTLAYITNKENPKLTKLQLRNKFALGNSEYINNHPYLTILPKHSREAAVFEARKNLLTNATHKKKFKMQFKTKKSNTWSIPIAPSTYSKTQSNERVVGFTVMPQSHKDLGYFKVRGREKDRLLNKTEYEPRLTKDNTNKYYLVLLDGLTVENQGDEDIQEIRQVQADRIASIDPGIRTRHSIYFTNGTTLQIGCAQRDLVRLLKLRTRAEKLRALIKNKSLKAKQNQKLSQKKKKLKIAANKATVKLNRLRKELDYKTIHTLFDQVDVVVLPRFEVQNMISGTRCLRKRDRIRIQVWGHYQFRMRIVEKAKELGKTVLIVSEHYTSKTCGSCGWRDDKLGSKKTFTCQKCGLVIDRDTNGARNILLRAIRLLRESRG